MATFAEICAVQFYTYLHCKPNGEPFYVGTGCGKRSHQVTRKNRPQHHHNIVAKYGAKNISVYVFPCASEEEAFADEIQQIRQLRAEGWSLATKSDGGGGYAGLSPSEETRRKLSVAMKGKKNCLGRTLSAEHRGNIARGLRGKKRPPMSPEWRSKIAAGKVGKLGKPHSAESKAKLSTIVRAWHATMTEEEKIVLRKKCANKRLRP